jgi:hypothetical protein
MESGYTSNAKQIRDCMFCLVRFDQCKPEEAQVPIDLTLLLHLVCSDAERYLVVAGGPPLTMFG